MRRLGPVGRGRGRHTGIGEAASESMTSILVRIPERHVCMSLPEVPVPPLTDATGNSIGRDGAEHQNESRSATEHFFQNHGGHSFPQRAQLMAQLALRITKAIGHSYSVFKFAKANVRCQLNSNRTYALP